MKKKLLKSKIYFYNIIIVVLIFLLSLALKKVSPFGEFALGKSDAFSQFKPMLFNFITKLKNGTLLNYSFNNGLGNPFIFDYLYYLSSPINLIAIFFKNADIMYLTVTITKLIIATISITFYTKSKTNNNYIITICSIAYVYSAWFLTYYYYLPWLDIFMIFPLYHYGLEKLLDEHKYHIYILTLSYMICTNFYLVFPVCIYTILYFVIYTFFYKKKTTKEKIITFDHITLATLFSFLISFFYLYALFDTVIKTNISFDTISISYKITIIDFFKSLLYGNTNLITKSSGYTFPNISCSLLILIPFLHFIINKEISNKNKIIYIIGITITLLVIFIPSLDFVLNAFHNIRGLTYRYIFIAIFWIIKVALVDMSTLSKNRNNKYLYVFPIIITIFIIAFKNLESIYIIYTLVFIICYLILILTYSNNKIHKALFIIIFTLEIFIASLINIPQTKIKKEVIEGSYNKNNTVYRSYEDVEEQNLNFNLYTNEKVLSTLTSMTYNKGINLLYNLGCETYSNTYAFCNRENVLALLLLNVKNEKNKLYLEKIYSVDKKITDTALFDNQIKYNIESTISNMTGIENIYDKHILKGKKEKKNYVYNTDYEYYLIEIDDGNGTLPQQYKDFYQDIKDGNKIAIIYTINKDKLKEIYNYLSKNQIKYSYYNDNHIKGTINVDKDQLIFTSISYDKDWIVKVDGKKVKPIELLNSLLGIEVNPGKHEIELEYKTHYLIPALISICTFILLIIDIIKRKRKHEKV